MNQLICTACATTYPLTDPRWRCECGGLLDIEFEPRFDKARIAAGPPTIWRYREAIPIADDADIVSLGEGYTPMLELALRGRQVWVKQDHLSPSGSYKDRGASVLISQAKALGVRHAVEDSSGNAGAAIAAYCAHAGIACDIYAPEGTSADKTTQIRAYGAQLRVIPGSREDTARAVMAAAETGYYASHSWNPFFFHGTKTWAFEVCEQLGWQAPGSVVLPAGNGTLLLGAYLGFRDLARAGVIGAMPKLIAVQAANCAPLLEAYIAGRGTVSQVRGTETVAEGIAIAAPARGTQMLHAVRETGGTVIGVSEAEIVQALRDLCARGFYVEPTSAATIAGLYRYLEHMPKETVVTSLTGHGLKATAKLAKLVATAP